jgi:hypothetical protein
MAIAGRDQGKRLPRNAAPRCTEINMTASAIAATNMPGRKLRQRRLIHSCMEKRTKKQKELEACDILINART